MNPQDERMSLEAHIRELRRRLITCAVGFAAAFVISFFLAKPLILFLQRAEHHDAFSMNAFRVTDPVNLYVTVAFILALIITSPLVLYQIWAFVKPGLYEQEQRVTFAYIPFIVVLFLAGCLFGYFVVFPMALHFMLHLNGILQIQTTIGITEYFHFLMQMTLPFGLFFEMPVLVLFLTRLGLISPAFLAKMRKYAYLILFVIAGVIAPPELSMNILVTLPLIVLYEISIVISRIVCRKLARDEKQTAAVSGDQG